MTFFNSIISKLNNIYEDPSDLLKNASNELKNNYDIVLRSVMRYPLSLEFASNDLRDDIDIVFTAVSSDPLSFKFASNRLKNNKIIISECMRCTSNINYISDNIKYDIDFILSFIMYHSKIPIYIFNNDFVILLKKISQDKYIDYIDYQTYQDNYQIFITNTYKYIFNNKILVNKYKLYSYLKKIKSNMEMNSINNIENIIRTIYINNENTKQSLKNIKEEIKELQNSNLYNNEIRYITGDILNIKKELKENNQKLFNIICEFNNKINEKIIFIDNEFTDIKKNLIKINEIKEENKKIINIIRENNVENKIIKQELNSIDQYFKEENKKIINIIRENNVENKIIKQELNSIAKENLKQDIIIINNKLINIIQENKKLKQENKNFKQDLNKLKTIIIIIIIYIITILII
jgi:hypothetical protein